mmetsp:Transcript_18192/g.41904  ORF Transcript_18192/g.41904 Transcript_18192/m.41904 type:complete len:112 (-) Transcript_18192:132-467(-)|eukprot:CAMPEP_0197173482 /NCGR_PEP_ID=MMETSP1423-20130617/397_1 /TAXON_ID=476441 /ORGANISM="Pseudo-nitzschia heimii, Strain UNC1101" /LENGTH=111 /DNA_ID=CAMNT_0042622305 /DNA_START=150 /DNA_END=485 /DNA_ORIENTATION=+
MSNECLSPISTRSVMEPNALVTPLKMGAGYETSAFSCAEFNASTTTEECTETVTIQVFYPTDKSGQDNDAIDFARVDNIFSTKLDKETTPCGTPEIAISADRQNKSNARAA